MASSSTASTLGIRDRDTTQNGQAADVVVFDPASVADTADYASPASPPVGMPHILVNGKFVVRDSVLTGSSTPSKRWTLTR